MSAALKIAGFGAVLAVVFAVAALAGAELDPEVEQSEGHADNGDESMDQHATEGVNGSGPAHGSGSASGTLPGLAVADAGYRLVLERSALPSQDGVTLAFAIVDDEGEAVREFDVEHERRMHLIVVRRDFANFQHLHPEQLADGSWEAQANLDPAGTYRAFADFSAEGRSLTLAGDLFAAGNFEPQPLPAPATVADAGDGYEVELRSPATRAGGSSAVEFNVSRDGRPVGGVEPYLGADGHLVALREHDQAFLHTHPEGEAGGEGPIRFQVEYPTAGRYRLFLQFRDGGEVRTAAFTQEAGGGPDASAPAPAKAKTHGEEAGHGH